MKKINNYISIVVVLIGSFCTVTLYAADCYVVGGVAIWDPKFDTCDSQTTPCDENPPCFITVVLHDEHCKAAVDNTPGYTCCTTNNDTKRSYKSYSGYCTSQTNCGCTPKRLIDQGELDEKMTRGNLSGQQCGQGVG